jgi:hypothetical protein
MSGFIFSEPSYEEPAQVTYLPEEGIIALLSVPSINKPGFMRMLLLP